ncbi:hypothetical protein C8R45DRAFT_940661 [Mycena sanguinolenta]|nr:hypothetical protein C8R45DRAFT_940661 [Mycena sanguinolenta]
MLVGAQGLQPWQASCRRKLQDSEVETLAESPDDYEQATWSDLVVIKGHSAPWVTAKTMHGGESEKKEMGSPSSLIARRGAATSRGWTASLSLSVVWRNQDRACSVQPGECGEGGSESGIFDETTTGRTAQDELMVNILNHGPGSFGGRWPPVDNSLLGWVKSLLRYLWKHPKQNEAQHAVIYCPKRYEQSRTTDNRMEKNKKMETSIRHAAARHPCLHRAKCGGTTIAEADGTQAGGSEGHLRLGSEGKAETTYRRTDTYRDESHLSREHTMLSLLPAFPSRASPQSLRIVTFSPSASPRRILSLRTRGRARDAHNASGRRSLRRVGQQKRSACDGRRADCFSNAGLRLTANGTRSRAAHAHANGLERRDRGGGREQGRRAGGAAGQDGARSRACGREATTQPWTKRQDRICLRPFDPASSVLLVPSRTPAGQQSPRIHASASIMAAGASAPLRLGKTEQEVQKKGGGARRRSAAGGKEGEEETKGKRLISNAALRRSGGRQHSYPRHKQEENRLQASQCQGTAPGPPTLKEKKNHSPQRRQAFVPAWSTLGCPPRLRCRIEDSDEPPAERIKRDRRTWACAPGVVGRRGKRTAERRIAGEANLELRFRSSQKVFQLPKKEVPKSYPQSQWLTVAAKDKGRTEESKA